MKKIYLLICFSISCFSSQFIAAQDLDTSTISATLENWIVEAYLNGAEEAYTPTIGREGTSILDYHILGDEIAWYYSAVDRKTSTSWAEQPSPIKIPTSCGDSLFVSSSPTFSSVCSFPISQDTTLVYNLIPQKIYWYRIVDSSKAILDQGVFKTLGRVREIYCPNVENIRDLGGLKCEGGRLKFGKLFRGAHLNNITDEDKKILINDLNIGVDVDLRHNTERPSINPLGVTYEWEDIMAYMYLLTNTYKLVAHPTPNTTYYKYVGNMIRKIVDNPNIGAFYYHCTAGADRTGTICALIEGLCGVSVEDIVKDWELTSFYSTAEKFISQEKASWWHKEGNDTIYGTGEMRSVFNYLYEKHNNKTKTYTFQQQVESWFKKYIFTTTADRNKYLTGLKNLLIEKDERSPLLIQDRGYTADGPCYLLVDQAPLRYHSSEIAYSATDGTELDDELITSTEFIDCQDFSYIRSNVDMKNLATFYDSSYKFIGGISSDENITDDTVLFVSETTEYTIPEEAVYIKINLPKHSNAYAVLSVSSILQ